METNPHLYQNAQFNNASNGGYLRWAETTKPLFQTDSPSRAPEPPKEFPKIDTLKQETDLS